MVAATEGGAAPEDEVRPHPLKLKQLYEMLQPEECALKFVRALQVENLLMELCVAEGHPRFTPFRGCGLFAQIQIQFFASRLCQTKLGVTTWPKMWANAGQ